MRPELRDKLLEVADAKVQRLGMRGLEDAVDQACMGFEKLAKAISPIRTRAGLIDALDRVELSAEQEKYAVPMARHFSHVVREIIVHIFESALKDLPAQPVGRKRVLTFDESAEVCRYVAELYAKFPDLDACKRRAAQKFGVSFSTVQRAWRKRGENGADEIQATEVIDYIKSSLFKTLFEAESATRAVIDECKEVMELADAKSDRML